VGTRKEGVGDRPGLDALVLRFGGIAELLEAEHVEYALIGGYALALQGIVRLTEDVDILVEPTLENASRSERRSASRRVDLVGRVLPQSESS